MTKQRPSFFPVAEHQLPTIQISPEQHEELRAYMLQMTHEVLREGPTWGRTNVGSALQDKWKLVSSTRDSCFLMKSSGKSYNSYDSRNAMSKQQLKGVMHTPPTAGQCFMGHSRVPYSLEEVMTNAYCETTEEARARYATTYGSSYLDGCVLKTLEGATLEDPFWYLGLKWLALQSSVTKLVSPREVVFVEHSGTHVQRDGQRMLYRILQSVDIRGYGGKDSYFGLIRGHVEAAFVYWADEAKSTPEKPIANMCGKGRVHLKGSLPLWLVQFLMNNLWDFERTLNPDDGIQHSDSEQSSNSSSSSGSAAFDMATEWVPNEDRATCYVCQRKFQLVRRPKHHCRSCGEVICSECTSPCQLNVRPLRVRKPSGNISRLELRSLEAMEAAHRKRMRIRAPKQGFDPNAPYVTVGKVCHRCIDLKSIMRNNSIALLDSPLSEFTDRETQVVEWESAYDSRYEELLTLTPGVDSEGRAQTIGIDAKSEGRRRTSGELNGQKLLIGRESSLTSSEVRAIINYSESGDALKSEDCAADGNDGEDFEYHPALANSVPAVHSADPLRDYSESLSGFNPDHLFDFRDSFSDIYCSDDDEDDAEEGVAIHETSSQQSRDLLMYKGFVASSALSSPLSPLSSSSIIESPTSIEKKRSLHQLFASSPTVSPTNSTALSTTSSWSRNRSQRGSLSIQDVKDAIADHAKLLDEIKRERDTQVP